VIRFLAVLLLGLAVWRLFARRSGRDDAVTVGWDDGTASTLRESDPLRARVLEVADRVAP
jgi:hypothetical protein